VKKTAWKSLSAHARTQKIQPSGHLNVLYHRTTWHLVPKVCCWGTATSSHVPRKWSCAQCSCSAVYLRVGEHNVSCSRSESIVGTDEMGHSSNRQWRTRRRGDGRPHGLKYSGQTLFSGQAQVAQKSWKIKNISIQWKISGQLLF